MLQAEESLKPEQKSILRDLPISQATYVHQNSESKVSETFLELMKGSQLQALSLRSNATDSSEALRQILTSCPNLKWLNLGGGFQVTDAFIEEIKKCPNLKVLDLTGSAVTNHSLKKITEACKKLFVLYPEWWPRLKAPSKM